MEVRSLHNETKSRTDNIAYLINQSVPVIAIASGVLMIIVSSLPQIPESRTSPLHTAGFSLFTLAGGAFTQRRKSDETDIQIENAPRYGGSQYPTRPQYSQPSNYTPQPIPTFAPHKPPTGNEDDWVAENYRQG